MSVKSQSNFPPSFYANYQVRSLTPAQQDELLANGWFRNDVSVFASSIKYMGDGWRSCVMLRVPLKNFTWKKRLRKLMRKNGELFTVVIRPFCQDQEKEMLWQDYKSNVHGWTLIPQLDRHLLRDVQPVCFNTWELCVYEDKQLVAFSVFDRGATSIASLEAAYHPAFKRFSLGVYTMLMEIDFAIQEGMSFYYPGFYPRDVPMFDYKLRPGKTEFFCLKEKRWLPVDRLEEQDWLYEEALARCQPVCELLQKKDFSIKIGLGLHFSKPTSQPSAMAYNLMLVVTKKSQSPESPTCLIAWDPVELCYMVFAGMPVLGSAFWEISPSEQFVSLLDVSLSKFVGRVTEPVALQAAVVEVLK